MQLYYDLHIHSCLSPCAEDEMTPGNICGMAHVKGLDVIAITDHNSALNLRAAEKMAQAFGLLLVPGMEICTKEEVHVLGYFPSVDAAEEMGRICRAHLPPMKNKPDFFGHQRIMNEEDEQTGEEDALLIGATDLAFSDVCKTVRSLGGVPVPAHIFRGNGLVKMLGFIPGEDNIVCVEVNETEDEPEGYRCLHSSDAHRLESIHEKLYYIETECSIPKVMDFLKGC